MFSRLKGKGREPPAAALRCDLDRSKVYSAGSEIRGVVHLDLDRAHDLDGKDKIVELLVTLRVGQHATYEGLPLTGGNRPIIDSRFQVQVFLHDGVVLWTPSDPAPDGPTLSAPFRFKLPPMEEQRAKDLVLPPSFEAGFRPSNKKKGKGKMEGNQIGSTLYLIKVEARRALDASKGVRHQLLIPVTYHPPQTSTPDLIPPPIFPPPATADSTLPILPPPRPLDEDGWRTINRVQQIRTEGMFHKPGAIEISLHLPSAPSYPTAQPIPFYLDLAILSPPALRNSPQPQLKLPSLSTVTFALERIVLAQAQGMQQSSQQTGGLAVVDLGEERRVWHGEMAYREVEEEGVMVGRWGRGVSVVGEMRFEGPGVGPSFLKAEKDLLGCSWVLSLHIPMKGIGADIMIDRFCSINLASSIPSDETTEGSWAGGNMEFPPSYSAGRSEGAPATATTPAWVAEKEDRE